MSKTKKPKSMFELFSRSDLFYTFLRNKDTRKEKLLELADFIFKQYYPNLKEVKIAYMPTFQIHPEKSTTLGQYSADENAIYINPAFCELFSEKEYHPFTVYKFLDTIIHEGRHAEQEYNGRLYKQNIKKFLALDYKDQFIALSNKLDHLTSDIILLACFGSERMPNTDRLNEIFQFKTTHSTIHGSTYYNELVERDARTHALCQMMNLCLELPSDRCLSFIHGVLNSENEHAAKLPSQYALDKNLDDAEYIIGLFEDYMSKHNIENKSITKKIEELKETISAIQVLSVQQFGDFYVKAQTEKQLMGVANDLLGKYEERKSKFPQKQLDEIDAEFNSQRKRAEKDFDDLITFIDSENNKERKPDDQDDVLFEFDLQQKRESRMKMYDNQKDLARAILEQLKIISAQPSTTRCALLTVQELGQAKDTIKHLQSWIDSGGDLSKYATLISGGHAGEPERVLQDNAADLFKQQEDLYNIDFRLSPVLLEDEFCKRLGAGERGKYFRKYIAAKNDGTLILNTATPDKVTSRLYGDFFDSFKRAEERVAGDVEIEK